LLASGDNKRIFIALLDGLVNRLLGMLLDLGVDVDLLHRMAESTRRFWFR